MVILTQSQPVRPASHRRREFFGDKDSGQRFERFGRFVRNPCQTDMFLEISNNGILEPHFAAKILENSGNSGDVGVRMDAISGDAGLNRKFSGDLQIVKFLWTWREKFVYFFIHSFHSISPSWRSYH